ncbi:MAG: D-alanyl-D-alanine carboxypeptidase [Micrococcales bacterium]|nr:D-alanyl-D-alanine carboxypeptidase [Micrococcales bacterium]
MSKPVRAGATALLAMGLTVTLQSAAGAVDVPPDYQVLAPVDGIRPVDRTRLARKVDAAWKDRALGSVKGLAFDAFASPAELEVERAADSALMPASTTKLLTAAAVLKVFGRRRASSPG